LLGIALTTFRPEATSEYWLHRGFNHTLADRTLRFEIPEFKDQVRATFYVFIELLHLITSKMPKYKFPRNVKDILLTFSYSFVGTLTRSTDRAWDFDARIRRLLRCLSHTRFHVCSQSAQRWKKSSEERGGVLSTYGHICPFPRISIGASELTWSFTNRDWA
jgi:hypothetical protein